jgi:hypothetical protein
VLIFPGLLGGDLSTGPLRGFLRWLGYDARGWDLGRNYGPTEQACVEPETALHQNVEVRCSHGGFGVDPATLWLIADRLARPAGRQILFRPPLPQRSLYPRSAKDPR